MTARGITLALPTAAAHAAASSVTPLELALIPAIAALGGVALGIFGQGWLDRRRDRRAARQQRDQAIAEILTATVDLISSTQAIRAAYDTSRWWAQFRTIAAIVTAINTAFASETSITRKTLLDWRKNAPLTERLLAIDQAQNASRRTTALDLNTVLLPRTSRFYAAVAVLTLGSDQKIAAAVRELTPAVTGLLDVITAGDRKYAKARRRAGKALGKFRDIADQRRT